MYVTRYNFSPPHFVGEAFAWLISIIITLLDRLSRLIFTPNWIEFSLYHAHQLFDSKQHIHIECARTPKMCVVCVVVSVLIMDYKYAIRARFEQQQDSSEQSQVNIIFSTASSSLILTPPPLPPPVDSRLQIISLCTSSRNNPQSQPLSLSVAVHPFQPTQTTTAEIHKKILSL